MVTTTNIGIQTAGEYVTMSLFSVSIGLMAMGFVGGMGAGLLGDAGLAYEFALYAFAGMFFAPVAAISAYLTKRQR
jgi:hypothetical protein